MKRISPKRRAQVDDVPAEYTALVEMTSLCEFCGRAKRLEPHHIAQSFRDLTLYDVRLIIMLCRECHDVIHALPSDHGRACSLALNYVMGRGDNVQHFYKVTGRVWPDARLVDRWIDRLTRERRAWQ